MPGKAVGKAAVDLPWLCPNTDGLLGLAENPATVARSSAADPALLIFLLRFACPDPPAASLFPHERVLSSTLPETAAAYLRSTPAGWVDPSSRIAEKLGRFVTLAAASARWIAERTPRVVPDQADAAARLAPLGWYAVTAIDPSDAISCLRDPEFRANPAQSQRDWWGLDHDAITRRLATRWRLPTWLVGQLGYSNLPFAAVRMVVPDSDLFAVVRLALLDAQAKSFDFGLTPFHDREELLAHLGLEQTTAVPTIEVARPVHEAATSPVFDHNPHHVLLLPNLLRVAAESRRRNGASLVARLEDRIDELNRAAASLGGFSGDRLRDAKLVGLAELAAGAGHEINNPLAVISGNAQRLLRTESDDDRAEALRAIVRQTQRIAGLLRDLMQFARPPQPHRQAVNVAEIMGGVRDDLAPLAAEKRVHFELVNQPAAAWVLADSKQLRHALAAVVRNGIEAAGEGGRVTLNYDGSGPIASFVTEDSGSGLTPEVAEHAFDPFYSGRSAGRGRGLGLPTAWQLARQNGGDLRHTTDPQGPTRFVLTVPSAPASEQSERRSA